MAVDYSVQSALADARRARLRDGGIGGGGGDGHPSGMDAGIAVLQQRADQSDQRMARVEDKLDRMDARLDSLATKEDVRRAENAAWNGLGIGAAIAVAVVGVFVAVLAYLQDQRIAARPEPTAVAASQPVIIQLPPWPMAPPAPAAPG